jgi:hypothetical protein
MFVNKGLLRSGVDFYGKMNAARENINSEELLIIGSSRALKQLDTRIFDSVTQLRSYNYGLNAASIQTCYNLVSYAVEFKKKARVVLLNIDYNMFDLNGDPYKEAYYYPYGNTGIRHEMEAGNRFVHSLKIFDISLYDDYAKYAAMDGWARPGRQVAGLYKGYYPYTFLDEFTEPSPELLVRHKTPFSENGLDVLKQLIGVCRKRNIELLLCIAPYYSKYFPSGYISNYDEIIRRVKEVAKSDQIPFLDFSSMLIGNDKANFYNVNHMNVRGATLYSLSVADTLKKLISAKQR